MRRRRPRPGPPRRKHRYRVNDYITINRVQVVDNDGKPLGVMETAEALKLARERELDLVEVAPNSRPPVAKIMDFGKFLYEEKQKKRGQKKPATGIKEITFRPNIGPHDLDVKLKKAREFLEAGSKVRFKMMFRGREIVHSEEARKLLGDIIDRLMEVSRVDQPPRLEGRLFIMTLRAVPH